MNPDDRKLIRTRLDPYGRLTTWPGKRRQRDAALRWLAWRLPYGDFTEAQVNGLLRQWHTFNDPALLRRELVLARHLQRTRDGRRYWRQAPDVNTALTALRGLLPDLNAALCYARRLPVPADPVVDQYMRDHCGRWRLPDEARPVSVVSRLETIQNKPVEAFLDASDRIMNSNTLLITARASHLWCERTLRDDLSAVLSTDAFVALFQESATWRDWNDVPWHEVEEAQWSRLLVNDRRPAVGPISASQAVARLMWMLTRAPTYHGCEHLLVAEAEPVVAKFIRGLSGAPLGDEEATDVSAQDAAEGWRWARVETSLMYGANGTSVVRGAPGRPAQFAYFDGLSSDGALLAYRPSGSFVLLLHNGGP